MFVKKISHGHILLTVLIIISLLSLFMHNIVQTVVLEYQRTHNQFLFQQQWQQLEFNINTFINTLNLSTANIDHNNIIGSIADSLEIGCETEIMLYTFTSKNDKQSTQLTITYSIRK